MKQKRVAVYCRVSTMDEMQSGSFEMQRDAFLRRIEADGGLVLAGVYGDRGRSGRSVQARPEFRRMLLDCEAGRIDLIMTKSVSRFARNLADCVATIRRLGQLGVGVIFEREGLDTSQPTSELLLCVLAILAQEESDSLSQNMRWTRRRYNEAGAPYGTVPYGYRAQGPGHAWRVEEAEARRVRRAFSMASSGCCYREIRCALQEMESAEGTGKVWTQSVLLYLLTNLFYTGDYITNKTFAAEAGSGRRRVRNSGQRERYYIEEHHPSLVDRATFARVQQLVKRHLLFSHKTRYTRAERSLLGEDRVEGA